MSSQLAGTLAGFMLAGANQVLRNGFPGNGSSKQAHAPSLELEPRLIEDAGAKVAGTLQSLGIDMNQALDAIIFRRASEVLRENGQQLYDAGYDARVAEQQAQSGLAAPSWPTLIGIGVAVLFAGYVLGRLDRRAI